ncbi:MAG: class I SAM-dependent methyltransferase [Opitutaceae bacterium]
MKPINTYAGRLRRHYAPLVAQHGGTHAALNWGSVRSQAARFRVLLEADEIATARVLDLGCGVGHLVDALAERKFRGDYCGLDLVPEMVRAAKNRHPDWDFRAGSLAAAPADFRPDYVVGSGLFTFANRRVLEDTVAEMFETTRRVVAFNSLSSWGDQAEAGEFCADPAVTLAFCRKLTRRVVLRHDYLPHDFTIFLHREVTSP